MLERLSSLALRAPRTIVALWAVVLVTGIGTAGVLFSSLDADLDGPASFESEQVSRRLDALDPSGGEVIAVVEGAPVGDDVLGRLGSIDGVEAVNTLPSDDGRATAVAVELASGLDDDAEETTVEAVARDLRAIGAPEVLVGGELLLDEELAELAERDAQRAEALSLPVALVVMAVVFGGILAAGLPLAIAFGGIGATMITLAVVASLTDVSLYALNVVLMLGMGLGTDYGLLMLSRFREERAAGHDVPAAVRRTMQTAGRTVVFSAGTVAVALVALLLFEDPIVRSLGIAGIGVVLACLATALTLLPALLGRIGDRLRPQALAGDHGWFARVARLTQRRALPMVVVVGAGLALLAVPFASARFDDPGARALPRTSETRAAALLMVIVFAGFVAGEVVPLKQLGVGLALAVVVDATVVRSLLVPATMKLMGRWNWWAPGPLARIHRRVGLREAPASSTASASPAA